MNRSLIGSLYTISTYYETLQWQWWISCILHVIQAGYYPVLALVGVPSNLLTIAILSRNNCGLSKSVTCYLLAMTVADLLVIVFDLILRHIPIVHAEHFRFLYYVPTCNIHAILLYASTDCSVWFTVTFTFDRFVAISSQTLKSKYCTRKTAAVVLGTVSLLSFSKNITQYFLLTGRYILVNAPWFCGVSFAVQYSLVWMTVDILNYVLTPCAPFVLILLLNVMTVRQILMTSKVRKRLRAHKNLENAEDSELDNRRKSIILLLLISVNFILLWAVLITFSMWRRVCFLLNLIVTHEYFIQDLGFMLQLLSCCTNTYIYAVTQTKFREALRKLLSHLFFPFIKHIK
ncbi:probable G-protein coupled receptor 139 [Stegostoma tigrinum]|uniref:probable G-protein coupled receptor 139 n=1 Tax=Stegostoma tigrinum TaxID=3053191 RepID=UPI0028708F48|nr:probable G-protein coupled receptor 139 [Stegostoma tigrinum]